MAIYVTRKCPKCKYAFERLSNDWIAFGDPRVKCPKCGQIVLFRNIKEWKLRSPLERFWILFRHYTFHNIAFSFGILIAIYLLLAFIPALWGKSYNDLFQGEFETIMWVILSSIIFTSVLIYRHKGFANQIRESNVRMSDPEYAEIMLRLSKKR